MIMNYPSLNKNKHELICKNNKYELICKNNKYER